jgi:hypothetical protein
MSPLFTINYEDQRAEQARLIGMYVIGTARKKNFSVIT